MDAVEKAKLYRGENQELDSLVDTYYTIQEEETRNNIKESINKILDDTIIDNNLLNFK